MTAHQLRVMQISEYSGWLRTQTNKHKRPFQEETIRAYAETARALDLWMEEREIDGDFTACDVAVIDKFLAEYRNSHTQGGTNTRQRNLHHLFKWLALRYEHPDPWDGDIVRYGPVGLNLTSNQTLGGFSPPLSFTAGKPHPVDCWHTARMHSRMTVRTATGSSLQDSPASTSG